MADFSLMNAIAAEIGEQRLIDMAKAYIMYVEDKHSGIPPPILIWGGEATSISEPFALRIKRPSRPMNIGSISPHRYDFLEPLVSPPRNVSPSNEIIHSPLIQ